MAIGSPKGRVNYEPNSWNERDGGPRESPEKGFHSCVDIGIFNSLKAATEGEGAMLEVIAPMVGGVEASDGSWIGAAQMVGGGPSVLYDAVALLPSGDGATMLSQDADTRDFVADAFAHMKFIGYVEAATPLFKKAGIDSSRDEGFISLDGSRSGSEFIAACRKLRFWTREAATP